MRRGQFDGQSIRAGQSNGHGVTHAATWRLALSVAGLFGMSAAALAVGFSFARAPSGPSAAVPDLHRVAVFGNDHRVNLPERYRALSNTIGLLFNNRSRTVCTAFCVAKDTVATAAHCLFRTADERPPALNDFWFMRRKPADTAPTGILGHLNRSSAQHVMSGTTRVNIRPPIDAASDWAIIRLEQPICRDGTLKVSPLDSKGLIEASARGQVFNVAFHRDFANWRLAYSKPCAVGREFPAADWETIAKDFVRPELLILHTCDTAGASSGSPLLIDGPQGPEVVGINVGTYLQSRVALQNGEVVRRFAADTVANTGVNAAAFADSLEIFRRTQILASGPPMRVLQQRLAETGTFRGPFDGAYGPELREAILDYEAHNGLPLTGLASDALLMRLASRAPATGSLPRRTP